MERIRKENMSEAIICGLVACFSSILVALIQNNSTKKLIEYQISELKKEVEKHNNVITRTYALESAVELHTEKISVANHRIDDLEKKVN